jgi:hypothetical protein
MGRIKGSKLDPVTGKMIPPATGAAVGGGSANPPAPTVRQPIIEMLAPGKEEDFLNSLPENTATSDEAPKTRRPRKQKEEIEVDPLMLDPVYKAACERLTSFGVPKLINGLCSASGKPMNHEEEEDVKALTYIIAKRANVDPGKSWFALFLTAFGVVLNLVVERSNLGKQLKALFAPKPKSELKGEAA